MRQLTTLSDAQQARLFADYLLALDIPTRLDSTAVGWDLWVLDEDHLARARAEWTAFQNGPQDDKFRVGARKGRDRREAEEEAEALVQDADEAAEPANEPSPREYPPARLTLALILACGIITVLTNADESAPPAQNLLLITSLVKVDNHVLLRQGLPEVLHGQLWRLVTPIFVHFGLIHLLFNVLWLHLLGRQIEGRSGPLTLGALVLVLAVLSNLGQYFIPELHIEDGLLQIGPTRPFGGMSGVVFGLFGYAWMKSRYQVDSGLYVHPNTVILMLGWFLLCLTPLIERVANTAHGVGLITGLVLGYTSAWWNNWGEPA